MQNLITTPTPENNPAMTKQRVNSKCQRDLHSCRFLRKEETCVQHPCVNILFLLKNSKINLKLVQSIRPGSAEFLQLVLSQDVMKNAGAPSLTHPGKPLFRRGNPCSKVSISTWWMISSLRSFHFTDTIKMPSVMAVFSHDINQSHTLVNFSRNNLHPELSDLCLSILMILSHFSPNSFGKSKCKSSWKWNEFVMAYA